MIITAIQHSKTGLRELADFFLGYYFLTFSSHHRNGKTENAVLLLEQQMSREEPFAHFNYLYELFFFACNTHSHVTYAQSRDNERETEKITCEGNAASIQELRDSL